MQVWKGHDDGKMRQSTQGEKWGKNINKAYHAFLFVLVGEDPDVFFISEDDGLEEEASDTNDVNEDEMTG